MRLDGWPSLALGSIAEKVHDNGTAANGLVNLEEISTRDPSVLLGLLPRGAILPDADDDIEAIIAEVEALSMALRAVADQSKGIVLEVILS